MLPVVVETNTPKDMAGLAAPQASHSRQRKFSCCARVFTIGRAPLSARVAWHLEGLPWDDLPPWATG